MDYQNNPELNPDIIFEFRKGDSQAFACFFHIHYRALCFFAGKIIFDKAEAEDIVKDAFIKLWRKHDDFETAQNIKAFLYITTRNACLNFLRHTQVKDTFNKEYAYLEDSNHEDQVLNQIIRTELLREIYEKIEELPEKRREVFKLAYLDGLKNEEIAEYLNISIFTVKEHKGKALQTLRLHFTDRQLILFLVLCAQCLELFHLN
jgi:RNA polymerase sigma-70 factor (family 1)